MGRPWWQHSGPSSGNQKPHRTQAMIALYKGGAKMREIAALFGVSTGRVQAILAFHKVNEGPRAYERGADALKVMAVLRQPKTESFIEIERQTGYGQQAIQDVVTELEVRTAAERLFRLRRRRRWLTRYAAYARELGHTPSARELAQGPPGVPSYMTLRKVFGSAEAAAKLAGLVPNRTGRRPAAR